ncbi:hypothetical protein [Ruminococcus sp.]|uniref:hypothetical protein n=1 Tax=Ruminococcus sp. TaxID=41978 RepID=UPI0025D7424D|nr:hypothetical protein [Ruminococcus sp.]
MSKSNKEEKDINISKLDKSLEGQGLLEDAEDEEYERTLAEQRRQAEERELEARRLAEEQRRERERQQEKERERRLAQERLELMKLKNGVIDESEATIKEEHDQIRELHGFEKVSNFFYHNKVWIIFAAFLIVVAAFIIVDTLKREKADLTVIMVANNGLEARQEELEEFFEKYTDDLDGNGYVHVSVLIVPMNSHSDDYETQNANSTKLIGQLQGGETILFITDSNTDDDIKELMTPTLTKDFPDNKYVDDMGMSWNMEVMAEELNYEDMPNDIHLSMRTPVRTLGDSKEKMQENYDQAFVVFKRIVDDMTEKAEKANDKGLSTEPVHYDDESSADSSEISSENN